MTPTHFRTTAVTLFAIALAAPPVFAQRDGRRNGGDAGRREGIERAQPRRGGESRGRVDRNDNRRNDRRSHGAGTRGQWEGRRDGGDRGRRGGFERAQPRRNDALPGRDWNDARRNDGRAFRSREFDNRRNDRWRYDNRADNWRGYGNRAYGHRSYDWSYRNRFYGDRWDRRYDRHYDYRDYGYRPHFRRSYVLPYGYRPYGYRPGWSLNLYFGRPYSAYGYPAYGYPAPGYGYYSLVPGRAYGALRIVDAPRDARVFVDGYYAGVVDDYDGVFQHLNLEAGPHNIEIEVPGYPPVRFDVYIEPGRTLTYRVPID
jgi:hypothetical protein